MDIRWTVTLQGTDTARCGTLKVSGGKGGPICRLARKMKAEGFEPGLLDVRREGVPVFARNMSIDWWAERSVSEPNASSVRLVRYVADPRFSEAR